MHARSKLFRTALSQTGKSAGLTGLGGREMVQVQQPMGYWPLF